MFRIVRDFLYFRRHGYGFREAWRLARATF